MRRAFTRAGNCGQGQKRDSRPAFRLRANAKPHDLLSKSGGAARNRTGDGGFADLCLTAWRRRRLESRPRSSSGLRTKDAQAKAWAYVPGRTTDGCTNNRPGKAPGRARNRRVSWSGKRDSNPRLRPWQGRTLPLSYSRSRPSAEPPMYYSVRSPRKESPGRWTAPFQRASSVLPLHQSSPDNVGRGGRAIAAGGSSRRRAAANPNDLPVLSAAGPGTRRALGLGSLLHLRHMWGALDRPHIEGIGVDSAGTSRPCLHPRRCRPRHPRRCDGLLHAATCGPGAATLLMRR
jgi:hypothetical protein